MKNTITTDAGRLALLVLMLFAGLGHAGAAEYFVTPQGADTNSGLSRAAAFLTIQRGVDSLAPGDTLTIGPGEYHGNVRRDNLGGSNADTVVRAEIPGTVVLRGDVPAPEFRPLIGHPYLSVADLAVTGEVVAVNELDTLRILQRMPNAAELDFMPGVFHHDRAAGKLYLSTSDLEPATAHRYSVSVIPTHGIYLSHPRRVTLEGLAVTGFNAGKELHYREGTAGGVWGIFLVGGKRCVIRDCRAWLNGWGIGLTSAAPGSGDNVIDRCTAWANTSPYWTGDMGGLTLFAARRDTIRNSTAFLNGMYGINIYGTGTDGGIYGDKTVPGNEKKNRSRLVNNLAWGNWCDFKIKTGVSYFHVAERCVGPGLWSIARLNKIHCLIGHYGKGHTPDNVELAEEKELDPQREFADPDNRDYRLQATSRFRRKLPWLSDRGPFPFERNIFYVRPDGDDHADGLSMGSAWKTPGRAARGLRPGDTLYLAPGAYPADLDLALQGTAEKPISIRGRGMDSAIVRGRVRLNGSRFVEFKRLTIEGGIAASDGVGLSFDNCRLAGTGGGAGPTVGLTATGVAGLAITHCAFAGYPEAAVKLSACSDVDLRGNLYDNARGAAVSLDDARALKYSGYNGYRTAAAAWRIGGAAAQRPDLDAQPLTREAVGPFNKPLGPYRDLSRHQELRLVSKPVVHSVSATTANLEWMTSLPAICELAWGETPACENSRTANVEYFATDSLTGLKPGRTYYFRIKSLQTPENLTEGAAQHVDLADGVISFTTLRENTKPATYYVAPDGNDANTGLVRSMAWRTIGHAAANVNVGDTVLIAGGTYGERVRIRASGESNAPITFACVPGEKVVMSGAGKALANAFVVAGKSHVRFDGFYFVNFSFDPSSGWFPKLAGDFNLHDCRDIRITRCFSDGRGGYTARAVTAWQVDGLHIANCVNLNKMSGALLIQRCPNLRLEHTVFVEPMISSFTLNNTAEQAMVIEDTIFTDMLQKKAKLNASFAEVEELASLKLKNNCFLLRCFPPEERIIFADVDHSIHKVTQNLTLPMFDRQVAATHTLFADPGFAGDPGVRGNPADKTGFPPDRLTDSALEIDFDTFFATHPEVVKRGIGLQPEAFKDFVFKRKAPVTK